MATVYEIPINQDNGNQEFDVVLGAKMFKLVLLYNSRLDRWVMNIKETDGTDIITGILLVTGIDLISQYATADKPQGKLCCYSSDDPTYDPDYETLGKTNILYFIYEE